MKIRPLHLLRDLDVDGFVHDPQGHPIGCTVSLLFDRGSSVRLGGSPAADRAVLPALLPSLFARLAI